MLQGRLRETAEADAPGLLHISTLDTESLEDGDDESGEVGLATGSQDAGEMGLAARGQGKHLQTCSDLSLGSLSPCT